ncbi:MAG TPA: SRPBCC domain-containing protein [Streptosporangiaceae bacterium]|nr:SRPBCC domain-containing protein [Streptosporangiaceae bacterium]
MWQGLTDPAFTRRYWQTELHTDWAKGSPVTWNNHGVLISDPGSVVLESDPYRRLSYTWHTMTPELAEKFGWDQEFAAKLAGEPRSKVTFDIEPVTQGVKLTVIHDGFEPGSTHRPDGQRRLAGCHLQPQDHAGNRRTPPGLVPRSPRSRHNGGVEIPDHIDAPSAHAAWGRAADQLLPPDRGSTAVPNMLALVVWLKSFHYLGYFPGLRARHLHRREQARRP